MIIGLDNVTACKVNEGVGGGREGRGGEYGWREEGVWVKREGREMDK